MKHSKELFSTSVVDDVLLPLRIILYYVSWFTTFPITYGQNMYRGVQGTHAYSNWSKSTIIKNPYATPSQCHKLSSGKFSL